jgi:hypothetical protein
MRERTIKTVLEVRRSGSGRTRWFDEYTRSDFCSCDFVIRSCDEACKPEIVQGDRGSVPRSTAERLRKRGIVPHLAKIGSHHGSGLGKTQWPVERSFEWLHSFRRLKIRYER